jgi:orotate phosphoribosyltransferase
MSDAGFAAKIAQRALELGAIKIRPNDPFTWASGYRMPLYNDNRLFLSSKENRELIGEALCDLISKQKIQFDVIAGVATGAIAHATTLANMLDKPLVYVREKPKAHGMGKRVEGLMREGDKVLLVEDLISTGKSSVSALLGIREMGGVCQHCFAIFKYGFKEAEQLFSDADCQLDSILDLPGLISEAIRLQILSAQDRSTLEAWRDAPFAWGEKNGFPKKEV